MNDLHIPAVHTGRAAAFFTFGAYMGIAALAFKDWPPPFIWGSAVFFSIAIYAITYFLMYTVGITFICEKFGAMCYIDDDDEPEIVVPEPVARRRVERPAPPVRSVASESEPSRYGAMANIGDKMDGVNLTLLASDAIVSDNKMILNRTKMKKYMSERRYPSFLSSLQEMGYATGNGQGYTFTNKFYLDMIVLNRELNEK